VLARGTTLSRVVALSRCPPRSGVTVRRAVLVTANAKPVLETRCSSRGIFLEIAGDRAARRPPNGLRRRLRIHFSVMIGRRSGIRGAHLRAPTGSQGALTGSCAGSRSNHRVPARLVGRPACFGDDGTHDQRRSQSRIAAAPIRS
jgi:hypothetical protein